MLLLFEHGVVLVFLMVIKIMKHFSLNLIFHSDYICFNDIEKRI